MSEPATELVTICTHRTSTKKDAPICGKPGVRGPCEYHMAVNDDDESLCGYDCCADCRADCADHI